MTSQIQTKYTPYLRGRLVTPLIVLFAAPYLVGCVALQSLTDATESDEEYRSSTVRYTQATFTAMSGCAVSLPNKPTPTFSTSVQYRGACAGGAANGVGTALFRQNYGIPNLDNQLQMVHGLRQNGLLTGVSIESYSTPQFVNTGINLHAYKSGVRGTTKRSNELEVLQATESLETSLAKAKKMHDTVLTAGIATMPWSELETFVTQWKRNPAKWIADGFFLRLPDDPRVSGKGVRLR